MSLNQTQAQIRAGVRKFANVQGTTALARHPDDDLNGYIDRALGSLNRKLTAALPSQRYLASAPLTTTEGLSLVALPADFTFLISLELTADGRRRWLQSYEMNERPALTSPDATSTGVPVVYRLFGNNLDLLPVPAAEYPVLVWYIPSAPQLTSDGDTFDTIDRLDDYVIPYAARFIAIKDKNWDLAAQCKDLLAEITPDIEAIGRNRDRNSPAQIQDVRARDRWGRSGRR